MSLLSANAILTRRKALVSAGLAMLAPRLALGQGRGMERPLSSPIVIAHRGASGLRPEHTPVSYTHLTLPTKA